MAILEFQNPFWLFLTASGTHSRTSRGVVPRSQTHAIQSSPQHRESHSNPSLLYPSTWGRAELLPTSLRETQFLDFMKILQLSKRKYCRRLKEGEIAWESWAHQFGVAWPLFTSSSFLPDIQTMKEFTQLGELSPSQNQDSRGGEKSAKATSGGI